MRIVPERQLYEGYVLQNNVADRMTEKKPQCFTAIKVVQNRSY